MRDKLEPRGSGTSNYSPLRLLIFCSIASRRLLFAFCRLYPQIADNTIANEVIATT